MMDRILIVAQRIEDTNVQGFIQGFKRENVETYTFNLGSILGSSIIDSHLPLISNVSSELSIKLFERKVRKVDPDAILILKGTEELNRHLCLIAKNKGITTVWFTPDDPAQFMHLSHQTAIHADHIFTTSINSVESYKEMGIESVSTFPLPVKAGVPTSKPVESPPDVLFLGRWYPERERYIKSLVNENINIKIIGPKWADANDLVQEAWVGKGIYGEEARRLRRFSKIVINVPHVMDMSSKPNWAVFETLAVKGFLITKITKEMPNIFENRKHLVWVDTPTELNNEIKFYLENKTERRMISDQGYEYIRDNFTYAHWAKKVINIVDLTQ